MVDLSGLTVVSDKAIMEEFNRRKLNETFLRDVPNVDIIQSIFSRGLIEDVLAKTPIEDIEDHINREHASDQVSLGDFNDSELINELQDRKSSMEVAELLSDEFSEQLKWIDTYILNKQYGEQIRKAAEILPRLSPLIGLLDK